MNARHCPRCRRALLPAARFCTGCGAALVAASAPEMVSVPVVMSGRAESGPARAVETRGSAVRPVVAAAVPPGSKRLAPALFLHVLYPGLGLVYAEAVGLALAHLLINTVGFGIALVVMARALQTLLQQQQPWTELLQLLLLLGALLLFWGQGLASTKRAVERHNCALAAGLPTGASGGRVVALIVWLLLALVALTGYLLVR